MSSESTVVRLQRCALRLFAAKGYDATTVNEIAAAAGVSHMTFFRHFPTKEAVVLTDPFDPLIAEAVAAQPADLPPLVRVRIGLGAALDHMSDIDDELTRQRLRLVARHPGLRAAMWGSNRSTEDAIADVLAAGGVQRLAARVVAGACLGAVMVALLDWADADADADADAGAGGGGGGGSLRERVRFALDQLDVDGRR